MATISTHSVKKIVIMLVDPDDITKMIKLVKDLFRKGKATNLTVIINCDFKQLKRSIASSVNVEPPVI